MVAAVLALDAALQPDIASSVTLVSNVSRNFLGDLSISVRFYTLITYKPNFNFNLIKGNIQMLRFYLGRAGSMLRIEPDIYAEMLIVLPAA
jgi:multisubunit Na+/H+ antiporter MnhE subunit